MSDIFSKKVMVVGLGYVGLPSAALIAEKGFDVIGYDVNHSIVNKINKGEIHIKEPGLESLVKKVVNAQKLRATIKPEAADIFIITVPTPIYSDKKADISCITSVINSISSSLEKGNLIILESTSPVGTTKKICKLISELRPDLKCPADGEGSSDLNIAYSPERILPGNTIEELKSNSRVVGGITEICTQKAVSFYNSYVQGEIFETNSDTAEMCKLAENSYRDVNLAFANELSMICDEVDINIQDVIKYSNYHPRVNILSPGCGVGGHCIPIDPWFLVESFQERAGLIKKSREVNIYKTKWVAEQIKSKIAYYQSKIPELKVCFLGLTYKADSDDLRESPALEIIKSLQSSSNSRYFLADPMLSKLPDSIDNVEFILFEQALVKCDIFFNLVNHSLFESSDALLKKLYYKRY